MSNQNERAARFWYEYNGERFEVPPQYVYQLHPSKGGGYEINAAFYTWAFNQHGISIMSYNTIHANQSDLRPAAKSKEEKNKIPTGVVYFAVECVGKDRKGIMKTGTGEVGNESITNFQRGFPFGIAAKRAKVNMGKEFFNLTDTNYAMDCRDFKVPFGEYQGRTLGDLANDPRGVNTIRWMASDKFTGDPVLKFKTQEMIDNFLDKGNNQNQQRPNNQQQSNQQQGTGQQQNNQQQGTGQQQNNQQQGTGQQQKSPQQSNQGQNPNGNIPPLTNEQKNAINRYRNEKNVTNEVLHQVVAELFGDNFSWNTATKEQGNTILKVLAQKHGNL